MAIDNPTPKWRNFAGWSAVGGCFSFPAMWGVSSFLHEDGTGAIFRSKEVVAMVGLALIFSSAAIGFSSWNRPLNLRAVRNFVTLGVVAIAIFLLIRWGVGAYIDTGALAAMGASERVAAILGSVLVISAFLTIFIVASALMGADLVDGEVADDMRERGRLFLYSYVWMTAYGLLLIVLSLAGPEGALSPRGALVGALALIVVLAVLMIPTWRLWDELDRTLSYEAGNIAFYLIWVLGSGWAMLAHLGFVPAPTPPDWVTLFTVLLFAASFIAVGRRKLLRG